MFVMKDKGITHGDLLDIGKDMDSLEGDEETFYQDQLLTRKC